MIAVKDFLVQTFKIKQPRDIAVLVESQQIIYMNLVLKSLHYLSHDLLISFDGLMRFIQR